MELLELSGCIVTIDAMGCRKEIPQGILDREAGYLLAVKENQGRLYQDVRDLFQSGKLLALETKGRQDGQSQAKRRALEQWVAAVNQHGGFGRWAAAVSHNPADIKDVLARHV